MFKRLRERIAEEATRFPVGQVINKYFTMKKTNEIA